MACSELSEARSSADERPALQQQFFNYNFPIETARRRDSFMRDAARKRLFISTDKEGTPKKS
jgi:hypothetical protein